MEGVGLGSALKRVSSSVRGVARNDTEDVVQEAVARAIRSGVSLEAEQWLRTVARRVAIDGVRRRREFASGGTAELEKLERSDEGDPEEVVLRAERSQIVRDALDGLPPRYRRALLAYVEEDSPAAVASRLGLSAAATWTLLSRARTRLRLQLEQIGYVPAMAMGHPRLRRAVGAVAAAGVATTAALAPIYTSPPQEAAAPPPIVEQAAPDIEAPLPDPVETVEAVVPDLPVEEVVGAVTSAVEEVVEATPLRQKVGTCSPLSGQDIGLELWIVEGQAPGLVTQLVELLPEPLRRPSVEPCG